MNNSDQEKKYIDLDSELKFLYKDIEEINKDSSYVKSKHDSFEFLFMGLAGGIIGGMWGNFFHDYFVKIDILWYLSFLSFLGCLFLYFSFKYILSKTKVPHERSVNNLEKINKKINKIKSIIEN